MPIDRLRLSVIDTGWPTNMRRLAPLADELGYERFWLTEHYSSSQSASPTVLAGIAAGLTTRLRIGTAGVLLNFRSPMSVAADFAVLESFHPGRIDLGVTSSLAGGGAVARRLLDGRPDPSRASYEQRVEALAQMVVEGAVDDDGQSALGPASTSTPEIWICGVSPTSAELAGRLGCSYSFHDHLKPAGTDGASVVATYVRSFKATDRQAEPRYNVAAYGSCVTAAASVVPEMPASYGGTPEECRVQLCELAARYQTNEIVIQDLSMSLDQQAAAYVALARQFELGV